MEKKCYLFSTLSFPASYVYVQSRDYDRLQELMFEALHYFAILARHGQVNRHDTIGARYVREARNIFRLLSIDSGHTTQHDYCPCGPGRTNNTTIAGTWLITSLAQ